MAVAKKKRQEKTRPLVSFPQGEMSLFFLLTIACETEPLLFLPLFLSSLLQQGKQAIS